MRNRFPFWGPAAIVFIAGSTHSVASGPIGPTIELSSLDGTNGFVCTGANTFDNSGISVSGAGDFNGDGIDDLIIGAYFASPNGISSAGKSYVVFGGPGVGAGGVLELSSLNGANGFVCNGIDAGDDSGRSVSCAGDINGDGVDDIIIGADFATPNGISYAGESYVVFGGPGVGASGAFELSSLNGANGFVCNGIDASDTSGGSVSGAGDVNGDGIDDFIIGAHRADLHGNTNVGESYVVFGGPGVGAGGALDLSSLNGANGFVIEGIDDRDYCGNSVSGAGDVNGDGVDDLIIGAHMADPPGRFLAGESYVIFGGPAVGAGGTLSAVNLNGANGFVCIGVENPDNSGFSVSGAGDVNGDGINDILIGARTAAPGGRSQAGESYVVFGAPGVGAGGTFDLSSLNGANGFVCNGIDASDTSGFSVSGAGDINGDGIDDLLIGALNADPDGRSRAGESYVVFGGPRLGEGSTLNLAFLHPEFGNLGNNGFVLHGIDNEDESGHSVSGAGDVNGDGIDDLIIGSRFADPNGNASAGESYVIFGRAPSAPIPGDINGDGIVDTADLGILIGNFGMMGP